MSTIAEATVAPPQPQPQPIRVIDFNILLPLPKGVSPGLGPGSRGNLYQTSRGDTIRWPADDADGAVSWGYWHPWDTEANRPAEGAIRRDPECPVRRLSDKLKSLRELANLGEHHTADPLAVELANFRGAFPLMAERLQGQLDDLAPAPKPAKFDVGRVYLPKDLQLWLKSPAVAALVDQHANHPDLTGPELSAEQAFWIGLEEDEAIRNRYAARTKCGVIRHTFGDAIPPAVQAKLNKKDQNLVPIAYQITIETTLRLGWTLLSVEPV